MPPRPVWRSLRATPFAAAVALLLLLSPAGPVCAAGPGLTVQTATGRSDAIARPRLGILIVPQTAGTSSRDAIAHGDEDAYAKRLRDLGFEVWTVGPAEREDLARTLREAASRAPVGAEIAVVSLGPVLGSQADIHLVPAGAPADLARRPQLIESETVRLGDLLRRLAARQPSELILVVDECQPVTGEQCDFNTAVGRSGASVIGAGRITASGAGNAPLAARASLREPLLAAMAQENQSFLQAFEFLRGRLTGSDLAVGASRTLSASFAFIPADFFSRLRTECNRVDAGAEPTAVRALTLDPLLRACETAVATYPYSRGFQARLAAAREQRTYQRAVAGCDDLVARSAYAATYPAGRFRRIVDDHGLECDRLRNQRAQELRTAEERRLEEERRRAEERQRADEQRRRDAEAEAERRRQADAEAQRRRDEEERRRREQAELEQRRRDEEARRQDEARRRGRTVARSASGWSLNYASNLLEVDPAADDLLDPQRRSYTTVWRSRLHGDEVAIYVQVSQNRRCGDARRYAMEQLAGRRSQITRSQDLAWSASSAYVLEGRGTARAQGVFDQKAFADFVAVRRSDPSTVVHVGGRFPPEHADVYRAEFFQMLNSMQLPSADVHEGICPK